MIKKPLNNGMENRAGPSLYDDDGVFIVGCERSGTTLLRVILDSHPHLCSGEETGFLVNMEKIVTESWSQLEQFGLEKEEILDNIRKFFLCFHHKYCETTGKKRWIDKTSQYVEHLEFVNELFPKCKVIHIIRDGRDVAASAREKWGKMSFFAILHRWPKQVRMGRFAGEWLGNDRYFEITYENLVNDPRKALTALTTFLGTKWDDALLNHSGKRHSITIQQPNIDKRALHPINKSKVGSWKRRLCWHERLFVGLGFRNLLFELGYINDVPFSRASWKMMEKIISVMGFIISGLLYQLDRK